MNDFDPNVGKRLKEIRKELGLTLESIKGLGGPTFALICRIEKGTTPHGKRLIKFYVNNYHVNERWILTGYGEKYDLDINKAIKAAISDFNKEQKVMLYAAICGIRGRKE